MTGITGLGYREQVTGDSFGWRRAWLFRMARDEVAQRIAESGGHMASVYVAVYPLRHSVSGWPSRLVHVAGHHEEQVAEAVQVAAEVRVHRLFVAQRARPRARRGGRPCGRGAAARRACEPDGRMNVVSGGSAASSSSISAPSDAIFASASVNMRAKSAAFSCAGLAGQLRADVEQLVLDRRQLVARAGGRS